MGLPYINATVAGNATVGGSGAPVFDVGEFYFVVRSLFYLVRPNETTYETMEEVPNYFLKVFVYIPIILIPEFLALIIQGRKLPRFSDSMCSLCCLVLIFLPVAIAGQAELSLYMWCYEKFHIVDLQWDSVTTWILCLLGTDLGLYFWHRAAHEINFIWAFHQVHHTSQDYNLTIGIRLPAFNRYVAILFYLPCALFFPPSVFYVHYQLNYIFQLWIHSDAFPKVGWIDYIINNPSLHRVHHGRNRYCIDKNYGAVFSFWDILFGTFERERNGEEIYYGLVHNINSFDPLYIQIHHLKYIWQKFKEYANIKDKLSAFLKGPGWQPGLPRLGHYEDIPEIPEDKELYDKNLSFGLKVYITVHFLLTMALFNRIKITKMLLPLTFAWLHAGFVMLSVACIGFFLEMKSYAPLVEGTRCALYFILEILIQDVLSANVYFLYGLRATFLLSALYWMFNLKKFRQEFGKKKIE